MAASVYIGGEGSDCEKDQDTAPLGAANTGLDDPHFAPVATE